MQGVSPDLQWDHHLVIAGRTTILPCKEEFGWRLTMRKYIPKSETGKNISQKESFQGFNEEIKRLKKAFNKVGLIEV